MDSVMLYNLADIAFQVIIQEKGYPDINYNN